MITIDRGNGIEMYDEALLENTSHEIDNENEHTIITEYRLDGKIVHRGVHVTLKRGNSIEAKIGAMNG